LRQLDAVLFAFAIEEIVDFAGGGPSDDERHRRLPMAVAMRLRSSDLEPTGWVRTDATGGPRLPCNQGIRDVMVKRRIIARIVAPSMRERGVGEIDEARVTLVSSPAIGQVCRQLTQR
jgi:hypothetical protein